ncbi:Pyruvate/Phosphoenolpyruvate kinase-like domain-containing protein [Jackrogersella minutella]|nr:Pyruvate/Phosphoenolpyruvate kinase-like domain-containing protein [Jackrogersella minutella]
MADIQRIFNQGKVDVLAVARLRAALADTDNIVVGAGVYDGYTARITLKAGLDCLYMTGAGVTMSRLGMPDLGVATLNDMVEAASMIASLDPTIPLIADADTGYGGPLMVGRTVSQYMKAGVAALHLEDQVQAKRCGHLLGKQIVTQDEFVSRIKAAVLAREKTPGDIVIIARSDALQSLGYEAARDRLRAAIDAGADVAFLEGITSKEHGKAICQDLVPTPCLFNCVPGGASPVMSAQEARDLGYRLIIFPGMSLTPVYEGVLAAAEALKMNGIPLNSPIASSPKKVFEVCGLKECVEFDKAAGGKSYSDGV